MSNVVTTESYNSKNNGGKQFLGYCSQTSVVFGLPFKYDTLLIKSLFVSYHEAETPQSFRLFALGTMCSVGICGYV